jgi:hypothetical protein
VAEFDIGIPQKLYLEKTDGALKTSCNYYWSDFNPFSDRLSPPCPILGLPRRDDTRARESASPMGGSSGGLLDAGVSPSPLIGEESGVKVSRDKQDKRIFR